MQGVTLVLFVNLPPYASIIWIRCIASLLLGIISALICVEKQGTPKSMNKSTIIFYITIKFIVNIQDTMFLIRQFLCLNTS